MARPRIAALAALVVAVTIGSAVTSPTAAFAATTAQIKLAQTDLNGLAYNAGAVDGRVGSQTTAATTAYQRDQCLDVDGAIGTQTLTSLKAVVSQVQTAAGITADGTYADPTTAAVRAYQSAHNLEVDGVAGTDTMAAMGIERLVASCHSPSGTGATIVNIAEGEVGTLETSGNCVPGKPYNICAAWCAAFATWVWRTAGVSIPNYAYVPDVYTWAVNHGKWYTTSQLGLAQPGYLIIFGTATNRYHIGIVDHVSGSTVWVISGNTTNPANSGQNGVFEKSYPLSGSVFYGLVHL
jgi:hypothetical protein